MQKSEILIDLYSKLNEIECINSGWCLFAAYWIYKKAKELWINTSIIQIDYRGDYIETNKKFLKWELKEPVSGNHYVIKFEWVLYCTRGIYGLKEWKNTFEFKGDNIDKFCNKALKMDLWNECFDKIEGVKQIESILWISLFD